MSRESEAPEDEIRVEQVEGAKSCRESLCAHGVPFGFHAKSMKVSKFFSMGKDIMKLT